MEAGHGTDGESGFIQSSGETRVPFDFAQGRLSLRAE